MSEDKEPVAWMHTSAAGFTYFRRKRQDVVFNPRPLYEHPLIVQWRGLTTEDLEELIGFHSSTDGYMSEADAKEFARDLEERLKLRNS